MKTLTLYFLFSFLLNNAFAAETATYQITFTNLWNKADHVAFPSNAHFSPIVAITHTSDYQLFRIGEFATPGFESLAETGTTATILQEIAEAQVMGSIDSLETSQALFPQRDGNDLIFEITVNKTSSLISFATMIAPSPDWVVGLDSLETFKGGRFINKMNTDLIAINTGTEEGDVAGNFSIDNPATQPHESLSYFNGVKGLDRPFATVTVKKIK